MSITAKIHSIETFATLDGPGVRYLIFLQGCPLRCIYCHNPDTWTSKTDDVRSVDEVMEDVRKYRSFISSGGVTLSGGEPLLQSEFCGEIVDACKKEDIHVAIDTSGAIPLEGCKYSVENADLLLLDIKSVDDEILKEITGTEKNYALQYLELREKLGKPVWIRQVIVPNLTMETEYLNRLADFLQDFNCIENVELLPFHKLGEYKWNSLGKKFVLADTPIPTAEEIEQAILIFKQHNIKMQTD